MVITMVINKYFHNETCWNFNNFWASIFVMHFPSLRLFLNCETRLEFLVSAWVLCSLYQYQKLFPRQNLRKDKNCRAKPDISYSLMFEHNFMSSCSFYEETFRSKLQSAAELLIKPKGSDENLLVHLRAAKWQSTEYSILPAIALFNGNFTVCPDSFS